MLLRVLCTSGFGSISSVFEWPLLSRMSGIFHIADYSATKGFILIFYLVVITDLF